MTFYMCSICNKESVFFYCGLSLYDCCCKFLLVWNRSFVWIYRNFPSCCWWRLSSVCVRAAFIVGKVGCDCSPNVTCTGVPQSFFIKRLQTFYLLCSIFRMDLGFFVCCFTCSKPVNYYELLGVKSNATSNEIKHAFFEKSKKVGSLFPSSISKKMSHQRRAA